MKKNHEKNPLFLFQHKKHTGLLKVCARSWTSGRRKRLPNLGMSPKRLKKYTSVFHKILIFPMTLSIKKNPFFQKSFGRKIQK